jgi:HD-like signal output (HDOD) protein
MNSVRPELDRIVANASTVYSLPLIHDRLTQAINNPRASFSDITSIISEDQGLCFRILKLANSPMFGYHKNIDSITKAATIIGTQQLRDMALAVSAIGVFRHIPDNVINMSSFWKHSITTGIVARTIATIRRESNVERFFVTGILHDIGQLILLTSIPVLMIDMISQSIQSDLPLYNVQKSQLGFDHADVGGELLKKWKIPVIIAEPVSNHHNPNSATAYPLESALLHVADLIAHTLQAGSSGESAVPELKTEAWELLDIPACSLATIIDQTDRQLSNAIDTLLDGMNT